MKNLIIFLSIPILLTSCNGYFFEDYNLFNKKLSQWNGEDFFVAFFIIVVVIYFLVAHIIITKDKNKRLQLELEKEKKEIDKTE